jgi:16S rRNA (cytosine967-C5)-methyltransferase
MQRRYDAIVLDVPCSNTGVLSRRPEARYRFSKRDLLELTRLQRSLLDAAADRLAPGGFILYSTCSVEAEENDRQTRSFCDRHGFAIVEQRVTLPRGETPTTHRDGGFAAVLRREGA